MIEQPGTQSQVARPPELLEALANAQTVQKRRKAKF